MDNYYENKSKKCHFEPEKQIDNFSKEKFSEIIQKHSEILNYDFGASWKDLKDGGWIEVRISIEDIDKFGRVKHSEGMSAECWIYCLMGNESHEKKYAALAENIENIEKVFSFYKTLI